jgi:TerC family integral membrane protein
VDTPIWAWAGTVVAIVAMLLVDLLVVHRKAHTVRAREAAISSAVWIALGLLFGLVLLIAYDSTVAGEYYAGYLIEKSLSIDNIFVFALLMAYFQVPREVQHRVLFWGVLGALVFRGMFITAGSVLLESFHFTIYLFGIFLVITGVRMARQQHIEVDVESNPLFRFVRRIVPSSSEYRGQRFFVRERGHLLATPLLAVLVAIESTDVLFAVDSIPAIFAVTDETFIVFTSNAFAILGLRALYFLLADMMTRFRYLRIGLAVVLVWVGLKMLLSEVWEAPIALSLAVIALLIGGSVVLSLRRTRGEVEVGAD